MKKKGTRIVVLVAMFVLALLAYYFLFLRPPQSKFFKEITDPAELGESAVLLE